MQHCHGIWIVDLCCSCSLQSNYYRPQRSCGKVMFSKASAILLTRRGGVRGRRGMRGRGGMCGGGGMHDRGCAWWGRGVCGRGRT